LSKTTYFNQFNRNDEIKLGFLQKLAKALDVPLWELIEEPGPKTSEAENTQNMLKEVLQNQKTIIQLLQKKNEFRIENVLKITSIKLLI
jgi:transcriptional regulator with XRE-family HTH domain